MNPLRELPGLLVRLAGITLALTVAGIVFTGLSALFAMTGSVGS